MVYSYYPGCTLKTKAKSLDVYARFAFEKLGVTLTELADWQCCGGAYTTARDEIATKLSAVRSLAAARENGTPLITLCAACHNVLKQVNHDMLHDKTVNARANAYLSLSVPYNGETKVMHYLELLRDVIGFDAVKKAVEKPLTGMKIAAYYGCLLLRPSAVMNFDNAENPTVMEDCIRSLGAEAVIYPMRNECCGSYLTVKDEAQARKKSRAVIKSAIDCGARVIVTACPLCLYNLQKAIESKNASCGCDPMGAGNASCAPAGLGAIERISVVYITELMAMALGNTEAAAHLKALYAPDASNESKAAGTLYDASCAAPDASPAPYDASQKAAPCAPRTASSINGDPR